MHNNPDDQLCEDMLVAEDEPVAAGRVLQPKIEAEVAFLLDRDIDVEAACVKTPTSNLRVELLSRLR